MERYKFARRRYFQWVKERSGRMGVISIVSGIVFALYFAFQPAYRLPLWQIAGWILLGWLSWTLLEYLIHRFLFHFPAKRPFMRFIRFALHGVHHEHPSQTIFLPFTIRLALFALAFYGLWCWLEQHALSYFVGILVGALGYLLMHYIAHHERYPHWFPRLAKHHLLHHCRFPEHAFGVSTRFWDWWFGTMPPREVEIRPRIQQKYYLRTKDLRRQIFPGKATGCF